MVAPIFNLRNVKVHVPDGSNLPIYGVVANTNSYASLAPAVAVGEVTVVLLTVQCSNLAAGVVNVTATIVNSVSSTTSVLVNSYPVIPNNAFDPLSGNLILGPNDVLKITATGGAVDVVVSLMEIANASSS
jgi:hypothetical protein